MYDIRSHPDLLVFFVRDERWVFAQCILSSGNVTAHPTEVSDAIGYLVSLFIGLTDDVLLARVVKHIGMSALFVVLAPF